MPCSRHRQSPLEADIFHFIDDTLCSRREARNPQGSRTFLSSIVRWVLYEAA